MKRRYLPAAALPDGAIIQTGDDQITVAGVRTATPRPGHLMVVDDTGREWPFGGAERVEVLLLPRTWYADGREVSS